MKNISTCLSWLEYFPREYWMIQSFSECHMFIMIGIFPQRVLNDSIIQWMPHVYHDWNISPESIEWFNHSVNDSMIHWMIQSFKFGWFNHSILSVLPSRNWSVSKEVTFLHFMFKKVYLWPAMNPSHRAYMSVCLAHMEASCRTTVPTILIQPANSS
jgi:hypothetical protein